MLFHGLCAFPITPADDDGIVDTAFLRRLIRHLSDQGVDSIGLLGSTGIAPYLDRAQRRRAVEAAVAEAAGRTPVMVGIGALRTGEAVRLGQDAAACGADAVLLAPVSYAPLTEAEVYEHVVTVAGAVDLPLCLYNNPGTTHFTFSPALIGRLSRVARVVAVKNPAPEPAAMAGALADLRGRVPAGFSLGNSVDWRAGEALLAGADAWYSVLAGLLPALCVPLVQAASRGDAVRARALDATLRPVWDLFTAYTSLRVVHAMAGLLGLGTAAPPRPILPLDDAALRRVSEVLRGLETALPSDDVPR
jgi:4-hydroxy-tetrahydrodipicolinate synthase